MKNMIKVLAVCSIVFSIFNANAQVVKNLPGLKNSMEDPTYNAFIPVGYLPAITTTNSNSFICTPSAYRLCIDVNGTMDTITLPNSYTNSVVYMQQYIDARKIPHLYTILMKDKIVDTDVYSNKLCLFTDFFDGYIQIVDTANTTTVSSYDTFSTQAEWQAGSSTYIDSTGVVGQIKINTDVIFATGTCTGIWVSPVWDRGLCSNYDRLYNFGFTASDSQGVGKTIIYTYRGGTTSAITTSAESIVIASGASVNTDCRYLQLIIQMASTNTPSMPQVDTITLISYSYVLTGDKLFYKMGFDTEKHYGTAPYHKEILGDSPIGSTNPVPTTLQDKDGNTLVFNMYRGKAVMPTISPLAMIVNEGKLFEISLGIETVTATSTHTYLVKPNGDKIHIVFNFNNSAGVIIGIFDSPTLAATQESSISLPVYNRDFTSSETMLATAWSNLTIADSGTCVWQRRYGSSAAGAIENQSYVLEWITEENIFVVVQGTAAGYISGSIIMYKE